MKLFITSQLKKITLQMWDWKFGKGIQMEKVSPLLCQTSEVLWTEGKTEKKKESVWMRVCWRQDSAPCLPGSQPLFQKKKITDTLLWTWEIQELGGTAHMTHLFWNSPWQQTCLIVTPAQEVRTAGEKRTGHPWAGEGHHRIEEPFRAHNRGTEGWGGDRGLSWSSDWVWMVQGGLCVW